MRQEKRATDVPTIFIIFGATGDLTQRKIAPALFDLYRRGLLPNQFRIVGFGRRELTQTAFREMLLPSVKVTKEVPEAVRDTFLSFVQYEHGFFDNAAYFEELKLALSKIDSAWGQCSNKLFYLAVPPALYDVILTNLHESKLSVPCADTIGWTRILVEKPFGNDSKTAEKLDRRLGKLFKEEQIFRIDHYLAKETIQNILTFRFSNAFFEPIWNRKYIHSVHAYLYEAEDTSARGRFYDGIGALRDVGQNHLLQMLALIAMGTPTSFSAKEIRSERAAVMKKLRLHRNTAAPILRGQYRGFREEKGVHANSETETYFKVVAEINNSRWRGVPFTLEHGKALDEEKVEITVHLRTDHVADLTKSDESKCFNSLTFHIQPTQGITLVFWAKKPGFNLELERRPLSFRYGGDDVLPDAYERVLFDCIRGDQTLFASTEEIKAEWAFMTPILKKMAEIPLVVYPKGTKPEMIESN